MDRKKYIQNLNTLKKNLSGKEAKPVPIRKLKWFNPLAAEIRKRLIEELEGGIIIASVTGKKKNSIRKEGVETVMFPMGPKNYVTEKKEIDVTDADFLVSVSKYSDPKGMQIRVNSRMGGLRYDPRTVVKTKRVIEDILRNRGIAYTKTDRSGYANYKMKLVVLEPESNYGIFNRSVEARRVINNMPQLRFTDFKTGRLKNPHMPYHR